MARRRPLWKCPRCQHRFVTKNLWHSCVRVAAADHFRGKPAQRKVTCRLDRLSLMAIATLLLAACGGMPDAAHADHYTPRSRAITVTTVPLLVKEERRLFPFLESTFARGGVLDGKEVYAFSPSTLTVVEGDTIHFTFINPEDDVHSFVLPDLVVSLRGATKTDTVYVARRAGIFPFVCAVQAHLPMMSGQLVVLPAASMAGVEAPSRQAPSAGRE